MASRALTDRDRALLAFERDWIGRRGKTRAIPQAFDLTPSRYYQLLAELIDRPEAAVQDPLLVRRLRRRRRTRLTVMPATGRADQRGRGVTK